MITTNIIHTQPNILEFTKYPPAHPVQTPTAQIARILQISAPSPPPTFSELTNPQPAIPEYTPLKGSGELWRALERSGRF